MNILSSIVEYKQEELTKRKRERRLSAFHEMPYFERAVFPLSERLQSTTPFAIIAEIKRSSPSAGILKTEFLPNLIATEYADAGAAAISVLTDERFFSGSLTDLISVRDVVQIPVLRKEFIIDEYQIFEAKAYGADAILLIAAILDRSHLQELVAAAKELQLQCLVELYDVREIDKLDFDQMNIIGINNRDLRTFEVNIHHSIEIRRHLPENIIVVSESGIRGPGDLHLLANAGIHAALIGEHFMKSDSPGGELETLLNAFIS